MKRAFTIIAMLAFVGTGCTVHLPVSLVKIDTPQAQFSEKVPLDIAISVPDESEMISTQLQPDLIGDFPIGGLINNASRDILLQAFSKGTVAKGDRIPAEANAILAVKVKNFEAKVPLCGILGCKVDMSGSLQFALLDMRRTPVWQTDVRASRSAKDPSPLANLGPLVAKAAAEMVAEIFQKAAKEIIGSKQVRAYATTGGPSTLPMALPLPVEDDAPF